MKVKSLTIWINGTNRSECSEVVVSLLCDLRPAFSMPRPWISKKSSREAIHLLPLVAFGNLKLHADTKQGHKCAADSLCFGSRTCAACGGKLLIRSIVGRPARLSHPVISKSSGEHHLTYHPGSVPIYLSCLWGFSEGRRWRWEEFWYSLKRGGAGIWLKAPAVLPCLCSLLWEPQYFCGKRRSHWQWVLGFWWKPDTVMSPRLRQMLGWAGIIINLFSLQIQSVFFSRMSA